MTKYRNKFFLLQVCCFMHFVATFFFRNVELFQKGDYFKRKETQVRLQKRRSPLLSWRLGTSVSRDGILEKIPT